MPDYTHFTLIFEGDIRQFNFNALRKETPFGTAIAAGVGNAFDQIEELEEQVERLRATGHSSATARPQICANKP